MVTIAQLRAVLALLHIETDQFRTDQFPALDAENAALTPEAEHAALLTALHRCISTELQRARTGTPADPSELDPLDQAAKYAAALHTRIRDLAGHTTAAPIPALLAVANHATAATRALLSVGRHPYSGESDSRWRQAIAELGHAHQLLRTEYIDHSNTATMPLA
ncbi:hypothetical protein ACIP5Y_01680 [Nocardia sp. NPDC088792]|uniref:hypothetical protein n=1 Tax=Nocardia sp. NPDC088792 TaxID=3364332 RepID=UPI0038307672